MQSTRYIDIYIKKMMSDVSIANLSQIYLTEQKTAHKPNTNYKMNYNM